MDLLVETVVTLSELRVTPTGLCGSGIRILFAEGGILLLAHTVTIYLSVFAMMDWTSSNLI
jgi:hypothetical protein